MGMGMASHSEDRTLAGVAPGACWSALTWRAPGTEAQPFDGAIAAAAAFALPGCRDYTLLARGTNCNAYRVLGAAGAFVLKEGTTYTDEAAVSNAAELYSKLAHHGVVTKKLRRTARGSLLHRDAASGRYWECSEYIEGRRVAASEGDVVALGRATARLHDALQAIDRKGVPRTNPPYWEPLPAEVACRRALEGLAPATGRSSIVDDVARALAPLRSSERVTPQFAIHGDLHLDNVLFRDAAAVVFDFDVARVQVGGLETEYGVLWHRTVRRIMECTALPISTVTRRAFAWLRGGYSEIRRLRVEPELALAAALLESLQKLAACRRHLQHEPEPWARFARNHAIYIGEILQMHCAFNERRTDYHGHDT